jgi:hypothetical protein
MFPILHTSSRSVSVLAPVAAGGIVDFVSSKAARLRRRQAVRRKKDKRLRKSGRVPQHTRAERRRAEAERQRQQEADRHRQARLRGAVFPVLASTSAASLIFLTSSEVSSGHRSYPYVSAAELVWLGNPDLLHLPEPDMTFYTSLVVAGTARADIGGVAPGPSMSWDSSERYRSYGPNIFGD